jgi:hypothetical protein
MSALPGFVASGMRFMTADQPDKFLRMHLMAMRVGGILLRHRALGAAVSDHMLLVRTFGRPPTHIGSRHGQLLASGELTRHNYPARKTWD